MGQLGVRTDKRREKELTDTKLVTPHGAEVTVTKSRAAALLARSAIRFGDGAARTYAPVGEDNDVTEPSQSGANPPRKGSRANTPEGDDK